MRTEIRDNTNITNITDTINRICSPTCSLQNIIVLERDEASYNGPHAWIDSPFVFNELKAALNSTKLSSSPDLDRIDYKTLQIVPYNLKILLLRIINNFFIQGQFPAEWCHSLVFLIPKPHEEGVQPIALTSCILKTVEKFILNRLYCVFSGFLQDRVTTAVFIDIKAAFDNVLPHILIEDLKNLKLPPKTIKFIENLISASSFISQGAVFSLTLFNFYLREISIVLNRHTKILKFVDDIVIFSTLSNAEKCKSVELSLSNIDSLLQSKGLDTSPHKTQLIIFLRQKYHMGKWGSHPQLLLTVYRSLLRSSIEYACHIFALKTPLKAIRLCLGYRISIPINVMFAEAKEPLAYYFRYLTTRFFIKTLSVTDYPVVNCFENLSDTIIDNYKNFEYLSTNFPAINLFRQLNSHKQTIYKSFILPQFQHSYQSSYFTPEIIYPQQDFLDKLKYYGSENFFSVRKSQSIHSSFWWRSRGYSTVFYTDGSKIKNDSYVGSACYFPASEIQLMHKISHCASIFSAEAWAIYNALLLIIDINTSKASIISDSMSVLKALQESSIRQNNYLIPFIKTKLEAACKQKIRIQFIWVPSYRGICGNEIADKLARRAIKEDLFFVPKEKLDFDFDKYLEHWAKFEGISFFERIYQKNKKPWYYTEKNFRYYIIVIVSRISSNHYNLNYSLFRKNLIDNKSCSCGHPSQDINHIVFCYPNTLNKLTQLRSVIVSAGHQSSWTSLTY
ncbi:hypothetical protein ACFW04_012052 [Cataglyphis niger]